MADYYVSAVGDDSGDGSVAHPWKTITRLNAALASKIGLNDRVLLRRGDTFYGRITPPNTLDSSKRGWLKIGAYGTGTLPIVSGYKILTVSSGWTQVDATTWSIDYSAANAGLTYTGYDSAQGDGDVGFIKVDGAIHGKKFTKGSELSQQWDFYSLGTTLYVYSSVNPTQLATDIRCSVDGIPGVRLLSGVEVADLTITGHGSHGVQSPGSQTRCRLLRCTIAEIGGAFLDGYGDGTVRYGNGVEVWIDSKDIYCEHNMVYDCYDTAFTIQGGDTNETRGFTNITWRRNLTYRNSQSQEYWYLGNGSGFVNCLSEYNTNLFCGYGWGAEVRPQQAVRVGMVTYNWGNSSAYSADIKVQRNIYFDCKTAYSYSAFPPKGMLSQRNLIFLRSGTKMQYQTSQTIEDAAAWAISVNTELGSVFGVLPANTATIISDADIRAAIFELDELARTGQKAGDRLFPIHSQWREI